MATQPERHTSRHRWVWWPVIISCGIGLVAFGIAHHKAIQGNESNRSGDPPPPMVVVQTMAAPVETQIPVRATGRGAVPGVTGTNSNSSESRVDTPIGLTGRPASQVSDTMRYFGFPAIAGLRSITPKILVTGVSGTAPYMLMASASDTTWVRDVPEGESSLRHHPWEDLEFQWTFSNADGTPYSTPARDFTENPVPYLNGLPDRIDPAIHQIGPEFAMFVREPGEYKLTLTARGRDDKGRFITGSTSTLYGPALYRLHFNLGYDARSTTYFGGTFALSVTIPETAPVANRGTFTESFPWNCRSDDIEAWLLSVCGAGNVELSGGADSDWLDFIGKHWQNNSLKPHGVWIRFVGALAGSAVTMAVDNTNLTTSGRAAKVTARRIHGNSGTTRETISIARWIDSDTHKSHYYDSNYDGSAGSPIGTYERPYTTLVDPYNNDPAAKIMLNRSNTRYLFKRGSDFRRTLSPATVVSASFMFSNASNVQVLDYGDESLPRPKFAVFGGTQNSSTPKSIFASNVRGGQHPRDLIVSGLHFELWNPDPAICPTDRDHLTVSEGINVSSMDDFNGVSDVAGIERMTLADCRFDWNQGFGQMNVNGTARSQAKTITWGHRRDVGCLQWKNEINAAQGGDPDGSGFGYHGAWMGCRYHGGGAEGGPRSHTLYNEVGNHTSIRFQEYHQYGIDNKPFVAAGTHKISIWFANDGLNNRYFHMSDCYAHGHSHISLYGRRAPNDYGPYPYQFNNYHGIFERIHHHRPGLGGDDGKSFYWNPTVLLTLTYRDLWMSRVGLNNNGAPVANGASDHLRQLPLSYHKYYRLRYEGAPASGATNQLVSLGCTYPNQKIEGGYFCHNILVKPTATYNLWGTISITGASIPKLEMHDNIYITAVPERLYTEHPQGTPSPNYRSLAQFQEQTGLEQRSVSLPYTSNPYMISGTEMSRSHLIMPNDPEHTRLQLNNVPIRVGW